VAELPTHGGDRHSTPICGVARAASLADAWDAACAAIPRARSAASSPSTARSIAAAAQKIAAILTEVIVAPDADAAALAVLARKKNLRVLLTGAMPDPAASGMTLKTLAGGLLMQTRGRRKSDRAALKVVTKRAPTPAELDDLIFAFTVCKHVKIERHRLRQGRRHPWASARQMSRVNSSVLPPGKRRMRRAGLGWRSRWRSAASPHRMRFFPFADGLEATWRPARRR